MASRFDTYHLCASTSNNLGLFEESCRWLELAVTMGTDFLGPDDPTVQQLAQMFTQTKGLLAKRAQRGVSSVGRGERKAQGKVRIMTSGVTANSQKQMSQGMASRAVRCCANCHALESDSVVLSVCSRCKGVRYCGGVCQKAHWKAGHKLTCAKVG